MYNSKIDVWSACIVIYILLTGDVPNCGARDLRSTQLKWSELESRPREFLKLGLAKSQFHRWTSTDMLNHPWIKDVVAPPCQSVEVEDMTQALFLARGRHPLSVQDLELLTERLIVLTAPEYEKEIPTSFDQMYAQYGHEGLQQRIQRYLSEMSDESFYSLMGVI